MNDYYNFANIRALLTKSFNIEELLNFCFDHATFRPVYDNWSRQNPKSDLVRSIIDHGYRQLCLELVLDWVKQVNPARYEKHQPYINEETFEQDEAQSFSVSILPDNNLGKGLNLGGKYRERSLRIVATDWTDYGADHQVRSGWLFIPEWTANHAITFFKVHVDDDGTGYVHLVDTADPVHMIYLVTEAGWSMEKPFHYVAHASDVWEFVWKT